MSRRLSFNGRIFGTISVSIPEKFAHDTEEQDLFAELAADLGFALSKLKTDVEAHRLNQIVTSIPQPISLISRNYRYLAVNDVYAELFETAAQKIIGQTPADFFGKKVFETKIRPRLDHVLKGTVLQYEIQADFPGQGNRWMAMSYYPYRNKNGEIIGVISHGHDITERKQTEEALRKSEERFSLAMEASKDGIWDWDLTTGDIYCSPALTSMLGYGSTEVIKHIDNWQDLIHPEDRQKAYQANLDCVNNLTDSFEIEYRMKTCDGGWKWILGRGEAVYRDDSGKAVRMIGTHQDITGRKETEVQLRFQSLVLNQIQDRVTVTDLDGVITYVNDAVVQALGYSRNELIGVSTEKFGRNLEKSVTQQEIVEDTLEQGQWRGEVVNQTADGQELMLDCRTQVVFDEQGRRIALAGISTDITERKKAEAEREKLQSQLLQAQKMESVGRLAGGVAHDFNNMLGVILGHTELALLQIEENHDLQADLTEIQKAATRSADLVKKLLAFARKQTISPKQIDLNDTVERMLNMLRRLIGEDIDLVWQPAAHLWSVKMDPSQIDQILANLCVNARDAISGVGKVTIETGKKTFDEEYCKEHLGFISGDFVLLAVSDNGCGMDKDTLDNLYEPFFTTKEVGKGTGLGLATVYGIVKQNNGFINVYSEPGQGSTFKIYLPRLVADEDEDKAVPEKKAAAGGSETILLVEDEPSILRMTRMMLERKGYSVLPAVTPAEAVEKAKNHSGPIDLLMTDVVMPEMNGRDLAGQIITLYPDIRLLFMSGYTANVIAHHGVLDDGVAFIQKPFSMVDMTFKVREVLDREPEKRQNDFR
ncbi:MAG: PAS domain S-box protein [Desulfotignum sp.]